MPRLEPHPAPHPTLRQSCPGGGGVDIDVEMIPLITHLWERGLATCGCCQDLGEAIAVNHSSDHDNWRRYTAFHQGRAWLKMPVPDGLQFLDLAMHNPAFTAHLRRWTHPAAWSAYVRAFPIDGSATLLPDMEITFPRTCLPELAKKIIS